MSLYNQQIKDIIHQTKAPVSGFIVDVMEYDEFPGLILRCYNDNYSQYSLDEKVLLSRYVASIIDNIQKTGILCDVEMV